MVGVPRHALHRFILRKARELTNADAGSLYLLEEHEGQLVLRFAVAQTGPHDEETYVGRFLALSEQSVAGSVALCGAAVRVAWAAGYPRVYCSWVRRVPARRC